MNNAVERILELTPMLRDFVGERPQYPLGSTVYAVSVSNAAIYKIYGLYLSSEQSRYMGKPFYQGFYESSPGKITEYPFYIHRHFVAYTWEQAKQMAICHIAQNARIYLEFPNFDDLISRFCKALELSNGLVESNWNYFIEPLLRDAMVEYNRIAESPTLIEITEEILKNGKSRNGGKELV
jgi:hypothetical protein